MPEEKPVHKNRKYPWEKWMDGREHTLVQGTDFPETIAPSVMRGMALRKAYDAQVECETSVDGNKVKIKFGGAKQRGAKTTKPAKAKAAKKTAAKKTAAAKKTPAKKAAAAAATA